MLQYQGLWQALQALNSWLRMPLAMGGAQVQSLTPTPPKTFWPFEKRGEAPPKPSLALNHRGFPAIFPPTHPYPLFNMFVQQTTFVPICPHLGKINVATK